VKFAASIEYTQDQAKIQEGRPRHRAYLTDLLNGGKLAASGPYTDDSGALIVYEEESLAAAEAILHADPFCQSGVFLKWTIKPWNAVFINKDLFGQ